MGLNLFVLVVVLSIDGCLLAWYSSGVCFCFLPSWWLFVVWVTCCFCLLISFVYLLDLWVCRVYLLGLAVWILFVIWLRLYCCVVLCLCFCVCYLLLMLMMGWLVNSVVYGYVALPLGSTCILLFRFGLDLVCLLFSFNLLLFVCYCLLLAYVFGLVNFCCFG